MCWNSYDEEVLNTEPKCDVEQVCIFFFFFLFQLTIFLSDSSIRFGWRLLREEMSCSQESHSIDYDEYDTASHFPDWRTSDMVFEDCMRMTA